MLSDDSLQESSAFGRICKWSITSKLSSYRNQPTDLLCKSIEWFLYNDNFGVFELMHGGSSKYVKERWLKLCEWDQQLKHFSLITVHTKFKC